jgi:hypothetical protein
MGVLLMQKPTVKTCCAAIAVSLAATVAWAPAFAAENGHGVYLLGFRGPLAGITPPPGVYLQDDFYVYGGSASADIQLPFGGQVIFDVDAITFLELPTGIWVTPVEIAGGNLAFSGTFPLGYQDIEASLGPLSVQDDIFAVGDPFPSAFIGWHAGNFHWQAGVAVNVPIGDYQDGQIANIAFNHWAADPFVTFTWLDPAIGIDVSAAAGVTFNSENPATDYKTGNEFHLEGAVSKIFSQQFSAGIVGYYYNQLTGDSGSGAVLGPFEGEVAAIGGTAGFNFQVGRLPVSTRVKYYHEFDVTNRLEGNAGFITVSMPLWVQPPPSPSPTQ